MIRRYLRLKAAGYHLAMFYGNVWMDTPDGSGGVLLIRLRR